MRRTPLKRGKGLKRGKRLERRAYLNRRTPMKKRNEKRKAKRMAEAFGDCARLARLLPCCVCGQRPTVAAHVRSRGASGKDEGNVIPMCATDVARGREGCHERRHRIGESTFDESCGLNAEVEALKVLEAARAHVCVSWLRDGACAVCLTPEKELEGPA